MLKKINKIRHFNVHIFFDIKHRSICVSFVVGLATASRRNEANVNIYLHLSDDEDPNYANSKIFLIHLHLCFSNRLLYNSIYSFSKSRQFITKSLTLTYLHHSEKKYHVRQKSLIHFIIYSFNNDLSTKCNSNDQNYDGLIVGAVDYSSIQILIYTYIKHKTRCSLLYTHDT